MFWHFSFHAPSFFSFSYSSCVRSALPLASKRKQEQGSWANDDHHSPVPTAILYYEESGNLVLAAILLKRSMRKRHAPRSIWDAVFDRQRKRSISAQFELHTNRIFRVSKHLGSDGCDFIIPVELMPKQWSKETDAL